MSETRKQYKVFLTERNIALLKAEKTKTGQTITDLLNAMIDSYFKKLLIAENKAVGDDVVNRLDDIDAKLAILLNTTNGTYRTSQYIAELENQNVSNDAKVVARKKALRSYNKLRNNTLSKEDYLMSQEEEEYDDNLFDLDDIEEEQDYIDLSDETPEDNKPSSIDMSKFY